MANVRAVISEHASRLRVMHEEVHRTFRAKPHGPDHQAASKGFLDNYDALALPGGLQRGLSRLKASDSEAIEIAVQFLEEDPWFFRSGYIKETMARHLKHVPLTDKQRIRLASVVSRSIGGGPRRLSQSLARLAPFVATPALARNIQAKSHSDDAEVRRRANHLLALLHGRPSGISSSQ